MRAWNIKRTFIKLQTCTINGEQRSRFAYLARYRDFHESLSRPDANTYIIRRDDGLFARANNTASRYITGERASERASVPLRRPRLRGGDPPTYRHFVLA